MIANSPSFGAAYEVEVIDASSAGECDFVIDTKDSSSTSSAVLVSPRGGKSWTASISGRDSPSGRSVSGLFATPNPEVLCAVERGTVFLIDVLNPANYVVVPTVGIVSAVVTAPGEGLLFLATPWSITAIGEHGQVWDTDRISIEELRIDEIAGGWLRGVADPEDDEPRDFALDLATGSVIGGANLW